MAPQDPPQELQAPEKVAQQTAPDGVPPFPVVGIGGIATIDDVMEFLVAGCSAVQIGTANFYNPTATMTVLDRLPAALAELGATRVTDVVGTLQFAVPPAPVIAQH